MKNIRKTVTPFGELTRNRSIKGISWCGGNAVYFRLHRYMHFSKNHILYISDLYISPYVNLAKKKKKKKLTTKFELKNKIGLNVTLTKECVSQVKNKSHYFQKKKN